MMQHFHQHFFLFALLFFPPAQSRVRCFIAVWSVLLNVFSSPLETLCEVPLTVYGDQHFTPH